MIVHDVTRGSGSLADAAQKVRVSQFIVVATNDHLVNPAPALEWAQAIHARTYVSSGDCGHRIFECDGPALIAAVRDFLAAP
jgi:homoserine O-acetyltransferase